MTVPVPPIHQRPQGRVAARLTTSEVRGPILPRALVVVAGAGAAAVVGDQLVLVLVLAAILIGVAVMARPDTAALVAVGLVFSNAPVIAVREHGVPGALAMLVPLLLLITLAHHVFARREPVLLPRAAVWLVLFLVALILGSVSSRDPVASVASLQTFLFEGLGLFILITNAVRGKDLVRLAAIVLVVVGGLLGALSLLQDVAASKGQDYGGFAKMSNAVVNKDAADGGSPRHAGPIGEQNRWAQSLAVLLPIAVALAVSDRSRLVRLVCQAATLGIVVGVVLTYSRGAVVGLVLTTLVAMALRWIRLTTAVPVAVVAVVLLVSFAPTFTDRASTVVSARSSVGSSSGGGAPEDGSFANRTTEATAAISVFIRHPVVGVGTGLFPSYFQDEARAQGADRIVGVDREAHNLYLGLAAESGLFGLATFAGAIGSILVPLARVRRRHQRLRPDVAALATGFALAVVTYLATGLFLHFAYIRYFWLLAALAAAMGMVQDPADETEPSIATTHTGRDHVHHRHAS